MWVDTRKNHMGKETIICPECGKKRLHHAKGLCATCYQKKYGLRRRVGYCASAMCPHHGKKVPLLGRGLCRACYYRERRSGTLQFYPKVRG